MMSYITSLAEYDLPLSRARCYPFSMLRSYRIDSQTRGHLDARNGQGQMFTTDVCCITLWKARSFRTLCIKTAVSCFGWKRWKQSLRARPLVLRTIHVSPTWKIVSLGATVVYLPAQTCTPPCWCLLNDGNCCQWMQELTRDILTAFEQGWLNPRALVLNRYDEEKTYFSLGMSSTMKQLLHCPWKTVEIWAYTSHDKAMVISIPELLRRAVSTASVSSVSQDDGMT
jgi:hypothetical protein